MISLIVQLLIAFPKAGSVFLKIRNQYAKELATKRHREHRARINEWMRDAKRKSDS